MIHPADERIVVCVKPAVKKKKHGTMSPHGKCTLEDDVAARKMYLRERCHRTESEHSKGPLQKKRAGCPARNSVFIVAYRRAGSIN